MRKAKVITYALIKFVHIISTIFGSVLNANDEYLCVSKLILDLVERFLVVKVDCFRLVELWQLIFAFLQVMLILNAIGNLIPYEIEG